MNTPFDVLGVLGVASGEKIVACLYLPPALTIAAGTSITGGTVTGTHALNEGDSQIFAGMSESPAGSAQYTLRSTVSGTALPDCVNAPYSIEARLVDAGTDMTSYTAIATAFAASNTVRLTLGPGMYAGGFLFGGIWCQPINIGPLQTHGDANWEGTDITTLVDAVAAAILTTPSKKIPTTDNGVIVDGGNVDDVNNPVDTTPATGDGTTPVDNTTIATDGQNMLVEVNGQYTGGVKIVAYRSADWDSDPRPVPLDPKGSTVSLDDGTWREALDLVSAVEYVIDFRIGDGSTQRRVLVP